MLKKYENLYLIFAYLNVCFTHREDKPSSKSQTFTKRVKIDIWVNDTSNQLLVRGSYYQITFSEI